MYHNWSIFDVLDRISGPGPQPSAINFRADSPFRPAYWRFARGANRISTTAAPAVDVLCEDLLRIKRWQTEPMPAWAEAVLADTGPLMSAIEFATGDSLRRAELEARVLADQPIAEIADRLCVSPSVVAAYEHFFWDVRPHLSVDVWIRHHAIRWDHAFVLPRRAVPLLWRLLGYRHGVLALDWLTTSISHQTLRRDGVDAYLEPDVPIPVELKHAIAGMRLPIPKTPRELMRLGMLQQLSAALAAKERAERDLASPLCWQVPDDRPLVTEDRVLALTRQYLREAA